MLSKKSKYAIKALIALAKNKNNVPVIISKISQAEKIPKKFLETILLGLKNQGILGSKKGLGGGYFLLKSPSKIMLSDVIRSTDGPIALIPCVSMNFYQRCEECADEVTCGLRDVAKQVRDASLNILSHTSIADLVNRENKLQKSKAHPIKTGLRKFI